GTKSTSSAGTSVSPTQTSTYTLTCGGVSKSVTVAVAGTTASAPTVNLSAKSKTLYPGSYSTLSWSSSNASSCTASGIWSGNKDTSGSQGIPVSSTGNANLSCSGSSGTDTQASETISVTTNIPALSGNTYTLTRDILEST